MALLIPAPAFAMHISEGILPFSWAALWYAVALPFVAWGLRDLRRRSETAPSFKPFVGLVGAAVFLISCMPIPVPTAGTCAHAAGTGLAAILIGPGLTVVVASIALTLQALFLAHGGLTTLGANIVSMGVAGAYAGYGVYAIGRRLGIPWAVAAFLAGLFSDWATYAMTSVELAAALHGSGILFGDALADSPGLRPHANPPGDRRGFPLRRCPQVRPEPQAGAPPDGPAGGASLSKAALPLVLAGLILIGPASRPGSAASWPGVDEAVIEKVAEKAGRPAREPFINTDQGDLLLFAFLLAGIGGGFVAGYNFRTLFPPKRARGAGSGLRIAETARTKEAG